ncbi:hypothetical protein HaLaN_15300 [Haematococcus lacustris]|uniref:Uncharacterized protein n=1 Tax=Haematococcus lacustris TaxID=44745 RepID=A0A699Z794_HAELA|nr:hypothetical protein HaLaN_15300 [Haematococcus lacustris]
MVTQLKLFLMVDSVAKQQ